MRFVTTSHSLQDIGKQNVLTRLIGLTRYGTALGCESVIKLILLQTHLGDQAQRFGIVDIEPARASQCRIGKFDIVLLRIKTSQRESCIPVPPVSSRKIFHEA